MARMMPRIHGSSSDMPPSSSMFALIQLPFVVFRPTLVTIGVVFAKGGVVEITSRTLVRTPQVVCAIPTDETGASVLLIGVLKT